MKDSTLFLVTVTVVLLSRVPFINAGYGIDPDAWRVVNSARAVAERHEYMASRLPGYPLQEIACSLFWNKGPIYFNGVTALLGALGIGAFAVVLKKIGCGDAMLAALALAFTPVVYINSVNSMDYLWALAFMMLSLYCVVGNRPLAAGVLLGAAVGCRITSGAMLIPFGIVMMYSGTDERSRFRDTVKFAAVTILVSVIVFSPVIEKYGTGFFTFRDTYPQPIEAVRNSTSEIWGIVGLCSLLAAIAVSVFKRKARVGVFSAVRSLPPHWVAASAVAVVLYATAFFRFPGDAGYFLPALPFVFLLLFRFIPRTVFMIMSAGIIASSFLISVDSVDRPWSVKPSALSASFVVGGRTLACDFLKGPILNDYDRRKERMRYVDHLLSFAGARTKKGVLVTGVWLPPMAVTAGKLLPGDTETSQSFVEGMTDCVGLIDGPGIARYQALGYDVFYVKGQEKYDNEVFGIDLPRLGAREIQ